MIDEAETAAGQDGSFRGDANVLYLKRGGMLTQLQHLSKPTELYAYNIYILLNKNYTSIK